MNFYARIISCKIIISHAPDRVRNPVNPHRAGHVLCEQCYHLRSHIPGLSGRRMAVYSSYLQGRCHPVLEDNLTTSIRKIAIKGKRYIVKVHLLKTIGFILIVFILQYLFLLKFQDLLNSLFVWIPRQ